MPSTSVGSVLDSGATKYPPSLATSILWPTKASRSTRTHAMPASVRTILVSSATCILASKLAIIAVITALFVDEVLHR